MASDRAILTKGMMVKSDFVTTLRFLSAHDRGVILCAAYNKCFGIEEDRELTELEELLSNAIYQTALEFEKTGLKHGKFKKGEKQEETQDEGETHNMGDMHDVGEKHKTGDMHDVGESPMKEGRKEGRNERKNKNKDIISLSPKPPKGADDDGLEPLGVRSKGSDEFEHVDREYVHNYFQRMRNNGKPAKEASADVEEEFWQFLVDVDFKKSDGYPIQRHNVHSTYASWNGRRRKESQEAEIEAEAERKKIEAQKLRDSDEIHKVSRAQELELDEIYDMLDKREEEEKKKIQVSEQQSK